MRIYATHLANNNNHNKWVYVLSQQAICNLVFTTHNKSQGTTKLLLL